MSSLFTINMNYRRGIEQANKLNELAIQLKKESDRQLEETINDISLNWQGENAQAYLVKCRKMQENLRKNAKQLKEASETVRKIVQNIYETEMRNYRIAQKRTYH